MNPKIKYGVATVLAFIAIVSFVAFPAFIHTGPSSSTTTTTTTQYAPPRLTSFVFTSNTTADATFSGSGTLTYLQITDPQGNIYQANISVPYPGTLHVDLSKATSYNLANPFSFQSGSQYSFKVVDAKNVPYTFSETR